MTIRDIVTQLSTIGQLVVLQRADAIGLPTGRFFMGQLTEDQIKELTEGLTVRG